MVKEVWQQKRHSRSPDGEAPTYKASCCIYDIFFFSTSYHPVAESAHLSKCRRNTSRHHSVVCSGRLCWLELNHSSMPCNWSLLQICLLDSFHSFFVWEKFSSIFIYRVGQKTDHFKKCMIPVYDDVGRRSMYQNVQLFIGSKLVFWLSPYLKILCICLEKRYYTENNN